MWEPSHRTSAEAPNWNDRQNNISRLIGKHVALVAGDGEIDGENNKQALPNSMNSVWEVVDLTYRHILHLSTSFRVISESHFLSVHKFIRTDCNNKMVTVLELDYSLTNNVL